MACIILGVERADEGRQGVRGRAPSPSWLEPLALVGNQTVFMHTRIQKYKHIEIQKYTNTTVKKHKHM